MKKKRNIPALPVLLILSGISIATAVFCLHETGAAKRRLAEALHLQQAQWINM